MTYQTTTERENHVKAAAEYETARAAYYSLDGQTPENNARFDAAYEALITLNKLYGFPYAEYNFDL